MNDALVKMYVEVWSNLYRTRDTHPVGTPERRAAYRAENKAWKQYCAVRDAALAARKEESDE